MRNEHAENPMLTLFDRIHDLTGGLCEVNPGPFGFGVATEQSCKIRVIIDSTPDVCGEDMLFPDGNDSYRFSVCGTLPGENRQMTAEEISAIAADSSDPVSQKVALALQKLEGDAVQASRDECLAAFDVLAEREIARTAQEPEQEQGISMGM